MARPSRDTIQSGVNGWDATTNDNFIRTFDGPFPIHEHTGDESDLAATFPVASYDNCLVWVDHTIDGWVPYHSDGSTWDKFFTRFAGASPFTTLTDTPASYSGEANKLVAVNAGETALEFITAPAETFLSLSDTPANFTSDGLKSVRVNTGETALEFYTPAVVKQFLIVALTDESSAIGSIATDVMTFRMPASTLTSSPLGMRISLNTATTTGIVTVDVNVNGSTILSTKLTIDATEKTSDTAAAAAVISTSAIADDDIISVDIDGIGDGTAKGLKLTMIYEDAL
jgi:hypothetical protein